MYIYHISQRYTIGFQFMIFNIPHKLRAAYQKSYINYFEEKNYLPPCQTRIPIQYYYFDSELFYNVKLNYNDVRMFSIESVKKTKVPSGLYLPSKILTFEEELYQNLKNFS